MKSNTSLSTFCSVCLTCSQDKTGKRNGLQFTRSPVFCTVLSVGGSFMLWFWTFWQYQDIENTNIMSAPTIDRPCFFFFFHFKSLNTQFLLGTRDSEILLANMAVFMKELYSVLHVDFPPVSSWLVHRVAYINCKELNREDVLWGEGQIGILYN